MYRSDAPTAYWRDQMIEWGPRVVLAIVILIFGANRLPELGKGIGAGIKNFKSSMKEGSDK